MKSYLNLLSRICNDGEDREGRNGKTRALFALQFRHDMRTGFPAITTKELKFRSVVGELLWFLSGSTNDNDLRRIMGYSPDKKTIWSANAEDFKSKGKSATDGDLGRIYGAQWRNWLGSTFSYEEDRFKIVIVDQIDKLVTRLRADPFSRYHVVTAWNPSDLNSMALPACHMMFQCFAHVDGGLSLSMIQRSCDFFLGVPFNIASYGLLLSMLAQVTNRYPRELCILFEDAHIYHEHFKAVTTQILRTPHKLPTLKLNSERKELLDFTMDDITLEHYTHDEAIKAPMIV